MKIKELVNPEVTPGGRALKFYASQRIEVRRGTMVKDSDDVKAKIKVVKNKVAPPFRTTELTIRFGVGIDLVSEIIDLGIEIGCLKQKGAWISYGENKWNGKQKLLDELYTNKKFYEELRQYVKDNLVGL